MQPFCSRLALWLGTLAATWLLAVPVAGHDFGAPGQSGDPTPDQTPPTNCDPQFECCQGQTGMVGNPVDAYTGRKTLEVEDLVVPGVVSIRMVRQYNSQSRYDSPLGYGWSFTYDYRLFTYADPSDDRVVVRGPEGRRYRYLPPQSGSTFESADPGAGRIPELELVAPPTSEGVEYVMTLPDGQRALFDTEGRLYAMQTPQGNRLRFLYIEDGKKPLAGMSPFAVDPLSNTVTVAHIWRIDEIREQLLYQVGSDPEEFTGRSVTFKYDSNGRIEYIESHDRRRVVYSYDEGESHPSGTVPGFRGNLAQVTGAHQVDLMEVPLEDPIIETYRYPPTPQVESPRYEFEHIHNLTYYDTGEGTAPHIATYDAETDRVVSQDLTFSHWQFQYTGNPSTSTTATRTITTPDASAGTTENADTTYEFDAFGMVSAKVDALGHRTEYDRPTNACPTQVRVYDESDLTTPIRTIVSSFTTDSRLNQRDVTLTVAQGTTVTETVTMEQGYFGLGPFLSFRETRSTKPDSNVFRTDFEYFDVDADGLPENLEFLKVRTDTPGTFIVTEFGYDADHGQLTLTTPPSVGGDALSIRREYFSASDNTSGACGAQDRILEGRLRTIQVLDGGTPDAHLRRDFCYDVAGNVSRITDALGHVTELAWDGRGRLVQRTEQIGASSMTWESTLFRYGAPNEGRTEAQDTDVAGHDLLQVETGALGPAGTSVAGHVRRFVRDSRGRIVEVQLGAPGALVEVAQHEYDSDGNRIESSEPTDGGNRRTVTLEYDEVHQLTKVIDDAVPTANETEFAYDPLGNRKEVTDAREQRTEFIYDELDRLIRVIQHGESLTTNFEYDPVGNVTGVEDPKIQTTTYEYDTLSRLVSVEQHLGQTVGYEYDDRNRVEKATNARGQALLYEYFIWGGLDKLGYDDDDDGTAERVVDYTYDQNGNVRTVTDAGTLLWDIMYDDLNRVDIATAKYIPGEPSLDSDYDPFGNRVTLTLKEGQVENIQRWIYDPRERLTATCMPQDEPCTTDDETVRFLYYDNDDLQQITHDNGAQSDLLTSFAYHEEGPIKSVTVGTAPLHQLVYTVDKVLNVDTIQETVYGPPAQSPEYDFDYDNVYRLISAQYPTGAGYPPAAETFPYDAAGNRDDAPGIATPWDYDLNNRILASPSTPNPVVYSPDADGNLVSRDDNGSVQEFSWDATNRLVEFVDAASTTTTYAYDPFGRRIRKTVAGTTTWYLWDGDRLLGEYDTNGVRQVRYAYGGGFAPAQVAYVNGGSESIYHVHSDHLGTPRMLTAPSGADVWRASYAAFGRAHVTTSLAEDFNIRFPGQYYDAETEVGGSGTGLHYNRYRYFSPELGRYISADPIGQLGDLNVFSYAENNPVTAVDPLGLYCTYSQSSGAMTCYPASPVNLSAPPDPGTMQPYYSQTGYSGTNRGDPHNQQSVQGRNNPAAADRADVGPIPVGTWQAGQPYYSPNTGPNTIALTPVSGDPCNNTPRNCSTFRIHGAAAGNSDASTGCIILPPNRTTIPPGEIIFVVP